MSIQLKSILPVVLFVVIGFSVYFNVLHGEFVSDDYGTVVMNSSIQSFDVREIFQSFRNRAFVGLTFAVNYHFGAHDVFGYHFVNIVLHIGNALLVFYLLQLFFQTDCLKNQLNNRSIAFLSALIFLVHPIQTQAAAFISQRAATLTTFLYLLTLFGYMRFRLQDSKNWLGISVLTMMLACFSKEFAITLPFMVVAIEYFLFDKKFKYTAVYFLTLMIVPTVFFLDHGGHYLQIKDQFVHSGLDWRYVLTSFCVIKTYLMTFILPIHLAHEYAYPIAQGIFDPNVISSIMLLVLLIFLSKRHKVYQFCLVWFLIAISVECAHTWFVHKNVIYDHWVYLGMVALSLATSFFIHQRIQHPKKLMIVIVLIGGVLSAMSYQRSFVWQNELDFWKDNVKKQPQEVVGYYMLSHVYLKKGQPQKALKYLREGLHFGEKEYLFFDGLGNAFFEMADCERAVYWYQKSIKLRGEYPHALKNISICKERPHA